MQALYTQELVQLQETNAVSVACSVVQDYQTIETHIAERQFSLGKL